MSSDLMLDFETQEQQMMNGETGTMSIDQDGEWDISLFEELDNLGDADELFQALECVGYVTLCSLSADGDLSVDSVSPAHTMSSVTSPASRDALSPYSIQDLSQSPQPSPAVSVCSESSGFSEPPLAKRAPKRTNQATRVKRPIQLTPKVSIQPRPVVTAVPQHAAGPLQTVIIQHLQTTLVPHPAVVKPAPVSIQPAPPIGGPLVLCQPAQVLQIHTPQAVTGHLVTMPTLTQERPAVSSLSVIRPITVVIGQLNDGSNVSQRQQRMIKNRESASQSRKKKKEYLLTLEVRLKMALSENQLLKNENGTLKRQLEGLLSENTVLKTSAPKRRAICLMVVLVFLMLNVGPMSKINLNFSLIVLPLCLCLPPRLCLSPCFSLSVSLRPSVCLSSEDKALMVVKKDPLFFGPPPPCLPPVNRTKCLRLNHELRGWVHRHEVERTKTRRMSNSQHRANRTIPKEDKKAEVSQVLAVQYTDSTEKSPGNELQVYFAPHRTYNDFFDEIHRRGDTFYVVSFRRDHLLLPATSHNKGSRPKMSVVLPAMNINDRVIKDKEFEVMMQIDCEVTDTRILHIKSSSIPPFLRVNRTHTLYPPSPADSKATPPVQVLMGSA
uniref:BZIP domain-containing protein n=1 Tax=Oncorhynchus tshawytscha TaxID=74940 RepID=A0AAZ3RJP7_ONCTS